MQPEVTRKLKPTMSLRSKLIGALLGVFVLYAVIVWLALELSYASTFERIEHNNSTNQLVRITKYIEREHLALEQFVTDWAEWDDTMTFVLNENDEFLEENLEGNYLHETLGMSFAAFYDRNINLKWGEVYQTGESNQPVEFLFPNGLTEDHALIKTGKNEPDPAGYIQTAQGIAIVASSPIHWSNGQGHSGGHLVAGKLLDEQAVTLISDTLQTPIEIISLEEISDSNLVHSVTTQLAKKSLAIFETDEGLIESYSLLQDLTGNDLALIKITTPGEITALGTTSIKTTLVTLLIAALIFTLTLWFVLKQFILKPLENLTSIMKGQFDMKEKQESGRYLLSTSDRLSNAKGLNINRKDEIGELFNAFQSLSSSLRKATTSIWRAAHIDRLTELPNRRLFFDRLTHAVDESELNKDQGKLTVMFIDLDSFKYVNDCFGHDIGDQLLIEVANRLKIAIGKTVCPIDPKGDRLENMVARIGGDEFTVLLASGSTTTEANNIASKIVDTLSSPIFIDGNKCQIGACVGLAEYPSYAKDSHELIAMADSAMYEAKRAGKSCWRRYVPGISHYENKKSA